VPAVTVSDRRFLVLHALAIKGIAPAEGVAESSGLSPSEAERILQELVESGQARWRGGRVPGFMLLPKGMAAHAELLNADVADDEVLDALNRTYTDFLPVNTAFKRLCTDWQMRDVSGTLVPNDHTDAEYDASVIARLDGIHEAVTSALAPAAEVRTRFGTYRARLSAALARIRTGDTEAFARPMANSYHDIWMELHQDLLVSLKRERSAADE